MNTALWLHNLAAWSAQAALVTLAGGLAAWLFRLRVARVRLGYWQALLAVCLLIPAAQPWRTPSGGQIEIASIPARRAEPGPVRTRRFAWQAALLVVLASGGAVRMLWLAAGFARLRRRRRESQAFAPLPMHLDRLRAALAPHADLRLLSSVPGPVTFGCLRPVVLLPETFAGLEPETQAAIVCHELLHVRRQDWLVTVAEECVRATLWFHPAVWWLVGQTRLAREQTVDKAVVEFTRKRGPYLNALLAMAGNRPELDLAPATLFLRKRHLKKRVALLLQEVSMSKRRLISFCAASSGLLLAAGWLSLRTFPLQAAPAPQEESQLLHSVAPKYPPEARARHVEGPVVLELQIDAAGQVADARVLSGPEELRNAALQAVLQWHYSPKAMSLPATTQVTLNFRLPKDGEPDPVTLRHIEVEGLSPSARDELIERLPVHEGDTVNSDVMESLLKTVRAFDDHLNVSLSPEGTVRIAVAPAGPPTKIRVADAVQRAKLRVKVTPTYPQEAKANRMQGAVILRATIGKDGKVENLQVVSGEPLLTAAAIEAVRQWQYETTLLNGDPIEVVTDITVNFTLAE